MKVQYQWVLVCGLAGCAVFGGATPARAQWEPDGVALGAATSDQRYPMTVPDGAGGAIITWEDHRSGTGSDAYAQRVNAAGIPQWTAGGVALCSAAHGQRPIIAADGTGGAIVTWVDTRSGNAAVYAQRLNSAGAPQWSANGLALCPASTSPQQYPGIVADGAAGAIVTWQDSRTGANTPDIYAQRVSAGGALMWAGGGVAVCTAALDQARPAIAADGAGGAIITWQDGRAGSDIYAQRVNASGVPQWTANGRALCTTTNTQLLPTIVADGAGGAIVTWQDNRSGTGYDIYAQRVSAAGAPQWAADGVALCTAADVQSYPTIAADGAGGAIVTWQDLRGGGSNLDIYAQRVNATGVRQWTLDGVGLCTAVNAQGYPTIAADGAGGAIVTWYDYRTGSSTHIYAQRVNAAGVPQWTSDGVAVCVAANGQDGPTIAADGTGGAIIAWEDDRTGTNFDVYAQRMTGAGLPQGCRESVALCTAADNQTNPTLVADGAGGSIIAWADIRNGSNFAIYAQRVNAAGAPQWTADGVALCTAANDSGPPAIVADGAGGAIVAWQDHRGADYDIYAQRVNAAGVPQWATSGVALCTATGDQALPTIVADGAGGAIVTWKDRRSGPNYDIYARRVNAAGVPQWTADGVALCTATGDQESPTIVADDVGGAIVTWQDHRGADYDIYAQRMNAAGLLQWTADGVALCTATGDQAVARIVADGAAGGIVTWADVRNGTDYDIYAQRVNAAGAPQWIANGVALCAAAGYQGSPNTVADGAGGAIVAWIDLRDGFSFDIYAQRVNAAGVPQWTADGVALCTASNFQLTPAIAADGAGGAIVTWKDDRSNTNWDVYAERVNGAGVPLWAADGVALSTAVNNQLDPAIVANGAGGAIVTWWDSRSGTSYDIYDTGVAADGTAAMVISPAFGSYGSSVAISGANLGGVMAVQFNGLNAAFTVNSNTSITATVPNGATAGPIAASSPCGTVTTAFFYPAGWPPCGVPVDHDTGNQSSPVAVSDGAGGAIVAWQDTRNGAINNDIYAQRMSADGRPLWPEGGVAVCTAANAQTVPTIVSDGAGGAIVTWQDRRGGMTNDIYAQRLDASGAAQWAINGVAVCTAVNEQLVPMIASDGAGGAVVTWEDHRGAGADIYAQRINATGSPQWAANGIVACTAINDQTTPVIASDGTGGGIVAWQDTRSGAGSAHRLDYAQRISAAGLPQWTVDGVAVSTQAGAVSVALVADGAGGGIVTWSGSGGGTGIYAQRMSGAGALQWGASGVTLSSTSANPVIVSDGANGAIEVWSLSQMYAQRVNAAGALQWGATGLALTTGAGTSSSPTILGDGAGGAIVAWQDHRSADDDIYVQRVAAGGTPQWTADGVALCTGVGDQTVPAIVADATRGAIVAWQDARNGAGNIDIYATRVRSNGLITAVMPGAVPGFEPAFARPNPFRNEIAIEFSLTVATRIRLEVFDVAGRRVWLSPSAVLGAGRHSLTWDGHGDDGNVQSGGIYFIRVHGPGFEATRRVVRVI